MPGLLRAVGLLLGWLAGSVLRIRRAHVEASMRAAGIDDVRRHARAMYASLGVSLLELLWMSVRGGRALERVALDPASSARWRQALGEGRGVVVAASHTGNWDLAACAVARYVPLLVVTKHLSVRWLDRLWQGTRVRQGVRLADAEGAMARAREQLRQGGAVAMMIDQVPASSRHAVPVEFLGRAAAADRAPAALAASTGVPLVVAASLREDAGGHVLHVLDILVPPRRPDRAWIDAATRDATLALDRFVRAHPSQWLWLHRRWKPMLASPCRAIPSSSQAGASTAA
jgi:KDO2-lipid IV(A) lauroyltransferase